MNTSDPAEISNGVAWAAFLSAGIGCAALGLCIDLAEASKRISDAMSFYSPVGNLSGKTTLAIVIWIMVWIVLHKRWKNRTLTTSGKLTVITLSLIAIGILAAFPPVFGL